MVYRGLSIISSGLEALDCMSIGWLERTSHHGRRRQSGPAFTATEFYHAVVGTLLSCELILRLLLLVLGRAFIWPQTRVVWPGLYHSYDCWKHVNSHSKCQTSPSESLAALHLLHPVLQLAGNARCSCGSKVRQVEHLSTRGYPWTWTQLG